MSDSMPVRNDTTEDPNYRFGAAKTRLLLIQLLTSKLLEAPINPQDPVTWALLWDKIAQINTVAGSA